VHKLRLPRAPWAAASSWKGYGTAEGVDRYCREHFATTVLPRLQAFEGFLGAEVLVCDLDDEVHVIVATAWDAMESVKRFAGDEYE